MSESAKRVLKFYAKHIENVSVGLTALYMLWVIASVASGNILWELIAALAILLTTSVDIIKERIVEYKIEGVYTTTDVMFDFLGLFILSIIPAGYFFQEKAIIVIAVVYWVATMVIAYFKTNGSAKLPTEVNEKMQNIGIHVETAREMLMDCIALKSKDLPNILTEIAKTYPEIIESGLRHLRAYEREKLVEKIIADMDNTIAIGNPFLAIAVKIKTESAIEGNIGSLYVDSKEGCAPLVNLGIKIFDLTMKNLIYLQIIFFGGLLIAYLMGYGYLLPESWPIKGIVYTWFTWSLANNARARIKGREARSAQS